MQIKHKSDEYFGWWGLGGYAPIKKYGAYSYILQHMFILQIEVSM